MYRVSFLAVLLCLIAASTHAQEREALRDAYLAGSFVLTATGAPDRLVGSLSLEPTEGPSGVGVGARMAVGVHLLPRLAIEGEFQFPRSIERESLSPQGTPAAASHRDITAMALVRTRFRPGARVQPGAAIGFGLVRGYSRERLTVPGRPGGPPITVEPDWLENVWGFTAGSSVRVVLSPALSLTPEVRVFGAERSTLRRNVSSWFVRSGVGLEWVFTNPRNGLPTGAAANRATLTPRAYMGGSFLASFQNEAVMSGGSSSIASHGIGGNGIGGTVTLGAFLTPRVSVEGEVSVPTFLRATRSSSRFIYHNRHRDISVSGLVRIAATGARRVTPEAVVGLSYIREDTYESTQFLNFTTLTWSTPSPEVPRPSNALGWTAGLDFRVQVSPQVAIVPALRLHLVARNNPENSTSLGLGLFVFRPLMGVRWMF